MYENHYIIDNITLISKCQCRCITKAQTLIYPLNLTGMLNDGTISSASLFGELLKASAQDICNLYVDECFIYGVFDFEDAIYVMGPAALKELSYPVISNYLKKNQFGDSFLAPYIPIDNFVNTFNFFYGLVTKDQSNPLTSYNASYYTLLNKYIDQQYAAYELENSEYERRHTPYKLEEILNESTVHGTPEFNKDAWQAGILSTNSQKQYEYECVCAITLITRTAIRAGVPESKAFGLSDVILQKLSTAQNTLEMKQIYEYGNAAFTKEIQSVQTQKSPNPYINAIKNYIAQNIYKKIRLEEIASNVNLSPNYLSNIFKQETGKTISHYILEEKINRACNLLKYSDSSISAIAEYIQVTPQNYFTKIFREITGTTPAKYRLKYKTDAFKN